MIKEMRWNGERMRGPLFGFVHLSVLHLSFTQHNTTPKDGSRRSNTQKAEPKQKLKGRETAHNNSNNSNNSRARTRTETETETETEKRNGSVYVQERMQRSKEWGVQLLRKELRKGSLLSSPRFRPRRLDKRRIVVIVGQMRLSEMQL